MSALQNLSIRRQLLIIIMLTCGIALLLACTALVAYDWRTFRRGMVQDVSALAEMIGTQSTAALAFNDPKSASEFIAALKARPGIVSASIYTASGEVLARYVRSQFGQDLVPSTPGPDGHRFTSEYLLVVQPIMLEGERIGTVYIQSDLQELHGRLARYAGILTAILGSCLLVAFLLSSRLQDVISGPILHLVQVADTVTRERNYGARAIRQGGSETGILIDSFNEMLDQIQERDASLQRARDELEQRVQERTAELIQANERLAQQARELERSNAELQQFAYVASHDLQEPLRTVTSYTQLLAKEYEEQLDAEAKRLMGIVVEGTVRMRELIQDLLAYSRVDSQRRSMEPTNCEAVLGKVLADLKNTIDETGAVVTHNSLLIVPADGRQLGQLFQNLIGNALKFRGPDPPRVHVSAEQVNGEFRFAVSDNGIGLEPQYAEKIFDIFQRLHSRAQYPGTGIGLAICKKIVERHGGRIWVESQPGQGTTFYFTIGWPRSA